MTCRCGDVKASMLCSDGSNLDVKLGSAEQAGPAVAKPSDAAWPSQHRRKSYVRVLQSNDWFSLHHDNGLAGEESRAGSCLVINQMV
jgi:hypothetical protein